MDHGTLTDNNGRKADFRNVIIIMTTNAGAETAARASIGFTHQDHSSDAMEVIKKSFTPEFRNRLDTIIQFGRLSHERSEEHTSELQSLMRTSYAVFCLKKKRIHTHNCE